MNTKEMIDGCHNDIACQFEDSPQLQRLLNDLQGEEMLIQDVVSYAVREGFAAGLKVHQALTAEGRTDGFSLQIGHGEEGLAVGLINFINCADILVVEGRCRLRLAKKSRFGVGIFRGFRSQEFQSD